MNLFAKAKIYQTKAIANAAWMSSLRPRLSLR